jgi:HlyD family secretion protein
MADSLIKADSAGIVPSDKDSREVVFVYDKGVAKTAIVKTGIQDNDYIEILSGLTAGTEVVTAPYNVITKKLKDGTEIKKVSKEKLND